MRFERERRALFASALLLAAGSCARHDAPAMARAAPADTAAARAIVRDRPERLVLPLAPRGAGRVIYGRIAPARAALDLPPPPADAGEPPAPAAPAPTDPASLELKPPIPRESPRTPSGGHGGRVTLDVRVDETGAVSDVVLVETDADSLTVLAATNAALASRYYPALLGARRVAVWTRQVFELSPGRTGKP